MCSRRWPRVCAAAAPKPGGLGGRACPPKPVRGAGPGTGRRACRVLPGSGAGNRGYHPGPADSRRGSVGRFATGMWNSVSTGRSGRPRSRCERRRCPVREMPPPCARPVPPSGTCGWPASWMTRCADCASTSPGWASFFSAPGAIPMRSWKPTAASTLFVGSGWRAKPASEWPGPFAGSIRPLAVSSRSAKAGDRFAGTLAELLLAADPQLSL